MIPDERAQCLERALEPRAEDDRLAEERVYTDGSIRLSPPPAGAVAAVDSVEAIEVFTDLQLYGHAFAYGPPLVLLSDLERSEPVEVDAAAVEAAVSRQLVWAVVFSCVPDSPSVAPALGTEEVVAPVVYHDVLAAIDAITGEYLFLLSEQAPS